MGITLEARDRASKELKEVGKSGQASAKAIAAGFILAQAAIAAFRAGARLAVDTVKSITTDVGRMGDDFAKASRRVGVGVEVLSAWSFVADLAGTSIDAVERSLGRLARNALSVADGTGQSGRAFARLGVDVRGTDGQLKDLDALLLELSDGFTRVESRTERAALAQEIFGRSGRALIPILEQGSAAIRAQVEEAKSLGVVFSAEAAAGAEAFVDAQVRLRAAITGIKIAIGNELLPTLTVGLERVAKLISENREEIASAAVDLAKRIGVGIFDAVEFTAVTIAELLDIARNAVELLPGANTQREKRIAELERALGAERAATARRLLAREDMGTAIAAQRADEIVGSSRIPRIVALREELTALRREMEEGSAETVQTFFDDLREKMAGAKDLLAGSMGDPGEAKSDGASVGSAYGEGFEKSLSDMDFSEISRQFEREIDLLRATTERERLVLKIDAQISDVLSQIPPERIQFMGMDAEFDRLVVALQEYKAASLDAFDATDRGLEKTRVEIQKTGNAWTEAARSRQVELDRLQTEEDRRTIGGGFSQAVEQNLAASRSFGEQLGGSLIPTLTQSFNSLFDAIVLGSVSAKDAFRDMALDMAKMAQRLAMQELVMQLVGAFFPSVGRYGGTAAGATGVDTGVSAQASTQYAGAKGAIVTRPTLALIGEAGPERVMPLDRAPGARPLDRGGGDMSVTINVYQQPGEDSNALVERMLARLRQHGGYRRAMRSQMGSGLS